MEEVLHVQYVKQWLEALLLHTGEIRSFLDLLFLITSFHAALTLFCSQVNPDPDLLDSFPQVPRTGSQCISLPRWQNRHLQSRDRVCGGAKLCPGVTAGDGDISTKTSSPKKPLLPKSSQPVPATRSSSRQGLKLGSMSQALSLIIKQLPPEVCSAPECLSSVTGDPTAT